MVALALPRPARGLTITKSTSTKSNVSSRGRAGGMADPVAVLFPAPEESRDDRLPSPRPSPRRGEGEKMESLSPEGEGGDEKEPLAPLGGERAG